MAVDDLMKLQVRFTTEAVSHGEGEVFSQTEVVDAATYVAAARPPCYLRHWR